eukprot:Sspe_Gene.51005::Locus_28334_Transcript_1_1_Confidence_1.000_Length_3708::g.51005::m.51005
MARVTCMGCMMIPLVSFVLLATPSTAAHSTHASRLVIFTRTAEQWEVELSRPSKHLPDVDETQCGEQTVVPQRGGKAKHLFTLQYTSGLTECLHAVYGDDTRHTTSEWLDPPSLTQRIRNTFFRAEPQTPRRVRVPQDPLAAVHLPAAVDHVVLILPNSTRTNLALSSHRAQRSLQDEGIKNSVEQLHGPTSTRTNIVILSAGFRADEQSLFNASIDMTMKFLERPQHYGLTEGGFPLSRYLSTTNIFSVFQPSVDAGADKPSLGKYVKNNLGCSYGSGTAGEPARALRCDRALSIALADTSPVSPSQHNTIVLALVNDADYGGTGLYHPSIKLATLYTGGMHTNDDDTLVRSASLLYHEIGHALADLYDEYVVDDEGEEDVANCGPPFTTPYCPKNCAVRPTGLGWQGWVNLGLVPANPLPGCYYKNYYRPGTVSHGPCLMEKLAAPHLCPVCREASALQLFYNGLDLTYPMCPMRQSVTYLAKAGWTSTTFFANSKLIALGAFHTTWTLDGVLVGNGTDHLTVHSEKMRLGKHTLRFDIVDQSDWVLSKNRPVNMEAYTEWEIVVLEHLSDIQAVQNVQMSKCTSGAAARGLPLINYYHYSVCEGGCALNYTSRKYQHPTDFNSTTDSVEGWLLGLGGALVGVGILVLLTTYLIGVRYTGAKPQKVLSDAFTRPIKYTRIALGVIDGVLGAVAVTIVTLLLLMYSEMGAVGKLIFLMAIAFGGLLFILAVIGLVAVMYRSVWGLVLHSVLLVLIILSSLVFSGVLFTWGYEANDEGSYIQRYLKEMWQNEVADDPRRVCSAEEYFRCSGWEVSCFRVESHANCPADCEETHQKYTDTCKVSILEYVHYWLPVAAAGLLALGYLLLCAVILNFFLIVALRKSLRVDKHRAKLLSEGPVDGLLAVAKLEYESLDEFRENLVAQFKKFDKSHSGHLTKSQFARMYEHCIGVRLNEEQLNAVFSLIDTDGSGTVELYEWLLIMRVCAESTASEVIKYMKDRKRKVAAQAKKKCHERIRAIDKDKDSGISLRPSHPSYEDALKVYGVMNDDDFAQMLSQFRLLAEQDEGGDGDSVVRVKAYQDHLKEKYSNAGSRADKVLDELTAIVDADGDGTVEWTEWVATAFLRRDVYVRLESLNTESRLGPLTARRRQ